ncbi:MAG: hypothetical protein K2W82_14325, partial [Candidatus Obscuribacterales bacterium]|nr:hypothetical protein [Candidatus Obscuribacterales bacterium]
MNQRTTYFLVFLGSIAIAFGLLRFISAARIINALYTPSTAIVEVTKKNFDQEVGRSPVPVLIEFYVTEDCEECRQQIPVVNKVLPDYAGKLKVVRVHAERNPTISRFFAIEVVPTHAILHVDSGFASVREGYLDEASLREFIDSELAPPPAPPEPPPVDPVPTNVTPTVPTKEDPVPTNVPPATTPVRDPDQGVKPLPPPVDPVPEPTPPTPTPSPTVPEPTPPTPTPSPTVPEPTPPTPTP